MTLWTPTRHDEAIEEMNALLAIDDDFAIAHERLAIWHYYLGNYDDAWRHVQRARELGHELPAQFLPLLRSMAVDPEREAR
jgi:tetratricopeptide (TPR) repeat protein